MRLAVFWLWFVSPYFRAGSADNRADEPLYKAVGSDVVLTPGHLTEGITSIMWKHGPDFAMHWDGDGEEVSSYRQFRVGTSLNISNGAMTITGLNRSHTGVYSVEINGKVVHTTELQVISPVSKPHVSMTCDAAMTYCVLTCEGNTTDAEPITFQWSANDMVRPSTNVYNISKDEKEPEFGCILKNPISSMSSDRVSNPFITRNQHLALLCIIPVVIVVVVIVFFIRRHRKGQTWTPQRNEEGTPEERSTFLANGQATPSQNDVTVDVHETSTPNSTDPASTDTCNGTGNVEEGTPEEKSAFLENGQATHSEDPPSDVPQNNNHDVSVTVDVHETSTPNSTDPASTDTCNGTGNVEEGTPEVMFDTPEEVTKIPTDAAPPGTSAEPENPAEMSTGEDPLSQEPPVDEEAADNPQDEDQI